MAEIDTDQLLSLLAEENFYTECHYRESVDTTFEWLRDLDKAGAPSGTVVIAGEQTAARGRRGRGWVSAPGGAWFGMLLKPELALTDVSCISVVTAVAIAEGIREHTNLPVQIKWPNDLWLYKKKLTGILSELTTLGNKIDSLYLGIGINVNNPLPSDVRITATSLAENLGRNLDLQELYLALLREFSRTFQRFMNEGFEPIRSMWHNLSVLQGNILIHRDEKILEAEVRGMSDKGTLIVERAGQIEELVADEVTLSLKES
jgi:BirA family biotin operon repressor/biotin-[acetyl-CoA-carboxylase] ligase